MNVSQLIETLKRQQKQYGDVPVRFGDDVEVQIVCAYDLRGFRPEDNGFDGKVVELFLYS